MTTYVNYLVLSAGFERKETKISNGGVVSVRFRGLVGGATDCQSHVAAQHCNRLNTPGLNARCAIEDSFRFRDLRKLIRGRHSALTHVFVRR